METREQHVGGKRCASTVITLNISWPEKFEFKSFKDEFVLESPRGKNVSEVFRSLREKLGEDCRGNGHKNGSAGNSSFLSELLLIVGGEILSEECRLVGIEYCWSEGKRIIESDDFYATKNGGTSWNVEDGEDSCINASSTVANPTLMNCGIVSFMVEH